MKCFPIMVKMVWAGNAGLMSSIYSQRKDATMIKSVTMYSVVCDRCGKVFGGTDTCSALFCDKSTDIGDYSDWEMIDGKHYCPDCYDVEVINGVYNVKAKEK